MSINIVQFTHPGGEHSISQRQMEAGNFIKDWNCRDHKRKYLYVSGTYINKDGEKIEVSENEKKNGNGIYFWGEWEPQSKVTPIIKPCDGAYPHFIHEPFVEINSGKLEVPEPVPQIYKDGSPKRNKDGSQKILIPTNTDPFVFGKHGFYYSYCKQEAFKTMRDLDKGSIILFGSTINQNTDNTKKAYFALDTVFVVGDDTNKRGYHINSVQNKLKGFAPEYYCDIMNYQTSENNPNCSCNGSSSCGGGSCGGSTKNEIEYICYHGASYDNPITCENDSTKKMYSFAPCKIGTEGENGFERVKLKMDDFKCILDKLKPSDFFQNNLNSAPKITETSIDNNFKIWEDLCKIIEKNGCYKAVKLNYK